MFFFMINYVVLGATNKKIWLEKESNVLTSPSYYGII